MDHSASSSNYQAINGSRHTQPLLTNHYNQLTPSTSSNFIMENQYPYTMGDTQVRYSGRLSTLLGKGTYSTVCPGYHPGTNALIAVKYIKENYLRLDNGNLPVELNILQQCNCVNIIRLIDSCRVINDGLYLALERGTQTLDEAITSNSTSRGQVIVWLRETCEAVKYLHNRKIIHCDIKPSNILLVQTQDAILVAKLSDFGLSKMLSGTNLFSGTFTSGKGTFPYMAPETLKMLNQKFFVTKAGDIFSLGMTMYYAISNGKYSFPGGTEREMEAKILHPKCKPTKLQNIYFGDQDLLWKMLEKDSVKRPKIEEVLSHCLFWTLKRKKDFIVDIALSFESSETDGQKEILSIRDKIDTAYKKHFLKVTSKKGKFNWLKLLDTANHRNILLSSKGRPDTEKDYGNYDSICKLTKLFRDKRMHPADIKTDADGNNPFTVNGIFNEGEYILYFLNLCPDFVEVIYSVVRDYPLPYTIDYYTLEGENSSNLSTPVSHKKLAALPLGNVNGTATLLKGSSITIYDKNLISEKYYRGFSDRLLNPAAVYKTSLSQRQNYKSVAEKWQLFASKRPQMEYFVPIFSFANTGENFYIATKFAKATLSIELQTNPINCRNRIVEYLENVLYGIACLHKNNVIHGKIDQDHILMFGQGWKVAKLCLFTLDQPTNNEDIENGMHNDLMSFANLLEFCFSSSITKQNNGVYKAAYIAAKDYTWDHLVRWIRSSIAVSSSPTITQISNHPLFWDLKKSFDFISFFWRALTINGKTQLDEQYANLYKEREGLEFNWIPKVNFLRVIDSSSKSGNNVSGLLCTISLAYKNNLTLFKNENKYMEHFNDKFPDLLIICFCAALDKGYLPECHKNDLRQFLCKDQTKKEQVKLSDWMSIPPVIQNT